MNILYLDNDECLGYFGLISGLFSETVCDYCVKLKLLENNDDRINAEALFLLFAAEMLDMGSARPGLKDFFKKMKKLKKKGELDKIIMYTSAERYSQTEKNYVNWVAFMKNLFEFYTYNTLENKDLFLIYDLDHSGRSDEIPRESADGATLKSVEVPLKRLGLSINDVKKIAFLDDRPQNIFINGEEQKEKLKRIGMLPYYYLPKKEDLKKISEKYDDDFIKLGMKSLSSILDKQYDSELDEFKENKYPIGVPYFDMTELEQNKEEKRNDTPPPSIDITEGIKTFNDSSIDISKEQPIKISSSNNLSDIAPSFNTSPNIDGDIQSIDISNEVLKPNSRLSNVQSSFNQVPKMDDNIQSIDISNEVLKPNSHLSNVQPSFNQVPKMDGDIRSIDISNDFFKPGNILSNTEQKFNPVPKMDRDIRLIDISDRKKTSLQTYNKPIDYTDIMEVQNNDSDVQSVNISMDELPKKIIQIGDAGNHSDNTSIDLTKMIEKSASKSGRFTDSINISSNFGELPKGKPNQLIQNSQMVKTGITNFNLSEDEIANIIPSISVSNISDRNSELNIEQENTKRKEKLRFKDFSEEYGPKKQLESINITNSEQYMKGSGLLKKNINNTHETLLNNITPLSMNQNINNNMHLISNMNISPINNDNMSIDITQNNNNVSVNANSELPNINLNNFSLNYD